MAPPLSTTHSDSRYHRQHIHTAYHSTHFIPIISIPSIISSLAAFVMSTFLFRFLLIAVCLSATLVLAAVPADEITSLPGWSGKLPSKHYSGFFPTTLDGSEGAMLHYWLTLSESNPATDPLVVWLQGGPGCSSLFGMLYENGQLHFSGETDNSTGLPGLVQNPYAWTKVANMLWLEQPVGVGFSYCLSNNCTCDYEGCAFDVDAYHFFVNFFKAYVSYTNTYSHVQHTLSLARPSHSSQALIGVCACNAVNCVLSLSCRRTASTSRANLMEVCMSRT